MTFLRYYILSFILLMTVQSYGQFSGTQFKEALKTKRAELHYVFSDAPGISTFENGRMMGICVDIMADFEFFLLDKYGITCNTVIHKEYLYDFSTFLHEVEESNFAVFGLSNVTKTVEREQHFKFSPPFIANYAVMLTNNDNQELSLIDSISVDFKELKAISVLGSTNMSQLLEIKSKYYPTLKIDCVKSSKEVIQIISENKNYFTIIDLPYWVQAKNNSLNIKEHLAGVQIAEEIAVIMPYETDWNIPLRKFLTEDYKKSHSYRKIITRHLGWETLIWLDQMLEESMQRN